MTEGKVDNTCIKINYGMIFDAGMTMEEVLKEERKCKIGQTICLCSLLTWFVFYVSERCKYICIGSNSSNETSLLCGMPQRMCVGAAAVHQVHYALGNINKNTILNSTCRLTQTTHNCVCHFDWVPVIKTMHNRNCKCCISDRWHLDASKSLKPINGFENEVVIFSTNERSSDSI